jgi:hypothetical protein
MMNSIDYHIPIQNIFVSIKKKLKLTLRLVINKDKEVMIKKIFLFYFKSFNFDLIFSSLLLIFIK